MVSEAPSLSLVPPVVIGACTVLVAHLQSLAKYCYLDDCTKLSTEPLHRTLSGNWALKLTRSRSFAVQRVEEGWDGGALMTCSGFGFRRGLTDS